MCDSSRYMVFAGEFAAEPKGGMRDLQRRFAIKGEAIAWAEGYLAGRVSGGWAHIWDAEEGKEVWSDKEAR